MFRIVFIVFHFMTMIIYQTLTSNLSTEYITYVTVALILFYLSSLVGEKMLLINGIFSTNLMAKFYTNIFYLSLIFFIFGFYQFISNFDITNVISLNEFRNYSTQQNEGNYTLIHPMATLLLPSAIFLMIFKNFSQKRYVIIYFIFSILTLSRSRILDLIFVYLARLKKINLKLVVPAFIVISLVLFLGYILGRHEDELGILDTENEFLLVILHLLYRLTSYHGVFHELYFTSADIAQHYPVTFWPISRFFESLYPAEIYGPYILNVNNPFTGWIGYVTPGYLGYLFIDFGYWGALFANIILGLIFGILMSYSKLKYNYVKSVLSRFLIYDFIFFSVLEMRTTTIFFLLLTITVFLLKSESDDHKSL